MPKQKIVKKTVKRSVTKSKPKYMCADCGTIVTADCCGVGFTRLICCGKSMKKKAAKEPSKKKTAKR